MDPTTATPETVAQTISILDLIVQGWYVTYPLIAMSVMVTRADDPPERVASWMSTVGDSALRGLDATVCYAVKANSHPEIIRTLFDEGATIRRVSGEIFLLRRMLAASAKSTGPARVQAERSMPAW